MSTQKGNLNRSRPQKYKNQTAFKNDLHDKSLKTKIINNIEIVNVCERCKQIIEWKIKYKKYKPLKTPSKCTKCGQKSVKRAYHNICTFCAKQNKICSKCGSESNISKETPSREESVKLDAELQNLLKELPERKRRTFIRYINRNATNKKSNSNRSKDQIKKSEENETIEESKDQSIEPMSKEDLLLKLKSLLIKNEGDNDNDFDDDDNNWDSDSFT